MGGEGAAGPVPGSVSTTTLSNWRRGSLRLGVAKDQRRDGSLGDIDKADRNKVAGAVKEAEEDAHDEVWATYRFVVFNESCGAGE